MALLSRKEFADLVGIQQKHVHTYKERGKIVVKKGMIDTNDLKNKLFIEERMVKKEEKGVVTKNVITESIASKEIKNNSADENIFEDDDDIIENAEDAEIEQKIISKAKKKTDSRKSLNQYELAKIKTLALIEKTEVETRLALLKEQKLMGVNIPTDMVRVLAGQMGRSYVTKFKDGCEKLIIEVSKMKSLSSEESAKLRGVLLKIINESIEMSIVDMQKGISIVQEQYILQRGVGEHG